MKSNKRNVLIGLVAVIVGVLVTVRILNTLAGGAAGGTYPVSLTVARAGQQLRVLGDVKLRGVVVGKVSAIELTRDGKARITLAMDPKYRVPDNVSAAISAKTLFGEKYVQLFDATAPSPTPLTAGDHIPESRTIPPLEIEDVLQDLQPLIDATDPGDLGGALHALAVGLAPQQVAGEQSVRNSLALENLFVALQSLTPSRKDLDRLLAGSDESSEALAEAAPDLVAGLDELDRLNQVLITHEDEVDAALRDVPRWMDALAKLLEERFSDLVDITNQGADILDLVASRRDLISPTITSFKKLAQALDTNLSTPCLNGSGVPIGQAHPELAGTTCFQIWAPLGEKQKEPGGYSDADRPSPDAASASAAYQAQVRQLLGLPFGSDPEDVALLLYGAVRTSDGLVPEALL